MFRATVAAKKVAEKEVQVDLKAWIDFLITRESSTSSRMAMAIFSDKFD